MAMSAPRGLLRLLGVGLGVLLGSAVQADQAPIRLLTFNEPPWVDAEDGRLQGPTIELIKQLFERAGVPYSIEVLPLKRSKKTRTDEERGLLLLRAVFGRMIPADLTPRDCYRYLDMRRTKDGAVAPIAARVKPGGGILVISRP